LLAGEEITLPTPLGPMTRTNLPAWGMEACYLKAGETERQGGVCVLDCLCFCKLPLPLSPSPPTPHAYPERGKVLFFVCLHAETNKYKQDSSPLPVGEMVAWGERGRGRGKTNKTKTPYRPDLQTNPKTRVVRGYVAHLDPLRSKSDRRRGRQT
jgi:hypothetical protein